MALLLEKFNLSSNGMHRLLQLLNTRRDLLATSHDLIRQSILGYGLIDFSQLAPSTDLLSLLIHEIKLLLLAEFENIIDIHISPICEQAIDFAVDSALALLLIIEYKKSAIERKNNTQAIQCQVNPTHHRIALTPTDPIDG